ncbi:MAG: hypothetical protein QM783_09655 [Phycisphaerales bacterium]
MSFLQIPHQSQYPLVEFAVAMMFVLLWAELYWIPSGATLFGLPVGQLTPDWARSGLTDWTYTWPIFAVVALLFSGLLASTIIDARTFTIPLQIPWACTLIGVVVHTLWAVFVQYRSGRLPSLAPNTVWSISTPVNWAYPESLLGVPSNVSVAGGGWWWWIGVAFGATAGLGISCLMLKWGWIRRSMDDYEQWETEELARQAKLTADPTAKADTNLVPIDPDTGQPADPTILWTLYPRRGRRWSRNSPFSPHPFCWGSRWACSSSSSTSLSPTRPNWPGWKAWSSAPSRSRPSGSSCWLARCSVT